MPGKKPAPMSPAKRKAAVEASLLRKIKTEDKIKTLQEKVIKTEKQRRAIIQEEKELEERKSKQNELKERGEKYRKEINRLTGVNKFTAPRNKEKITATMKDVTQSSTILHKLNERILNKEAISRKDLDSFSENFKMLLFKNEIVKDMIALHQPKKSISLNERNKFEERNIELTEEITKTQNNFQRMMQLDSDRRNSGDMKTKTLEEYLDEHLQGLKKEIYSLNKEIKSVNCELKNITTVVEERRKEVENTKQAIKNAPNKSIEKSREYKKVVEKNKQLQTQIDTCLNQQDELTSQTRQIMNQIEEEKRRKNEESSSEIEIKETLEKLNEHLKLNKISEEKDNSVLEDLIQQNKIRDDYLKKMESISSRMGKECRDEYSKLKSIKKQLNQVESENKDALELISRISKQALKSVPLEYFHDY